MIMWDNPEESKHEAQCPPETHLMNERKPAYEIKKPTVQLFTTFKSELITSKVYRFYKYYETSLSNYWRGISPSSAGNTATNKLLFNPTVTYHVCVKTTWKDHFCLYSAYQLSFYIKFDWQRDFYW